MSKSKTSNQAAVDPFGWAYLVFMSAALLIGGASQEAPVNELVIRLLSIGLLGWAAVRLVSGHAKAPVWPVLTLVLIASLVIGWQLIALPINLVEAIPGRSLILADLRAFGIDPSTRPATLSPALTLDALMGLLPWAAAALGALTLGSGAVRLVMLAAITVALLSVALGALQFANPGSFEFYPDNDDLRRVGHGVFANRNHWGSLLVICFPLAVWCWTKRMFGDGGGGVTVLAVVCSLLVVGVGASGSRAALMLLAGTIGAVVIWAILGRLGRGSGIGKAISGLAVLVLALGLFTVAQRWEGVVRLQEEGVEDVKRTIIWGQSVEIAGRFWPFGAGGETFSAVYRVFEPLEILDSRYTNRAHNEYLGIAVEHGLPGLLLIGLIAVISALLVWRQLVHHRQPFAEIALLVLPLVVLVAHTAVDYPLRTPAIAVLACFLWVVVVYHKQLMAPTGTRDPGSKTR